ncbi:DUF559 domain-containing protein [Paenibacillus thermotolerans]|uniref:DUF559 domain-containing protein n=1 Tax=Paenibacillus thermotolerans TaxID=3027807 RepID=UPI002368482C|nr:MULTISPECIES: DUF559 domain-containing protein [unclassified Paenibacillus]
MELHPAVVAFIRKTELEAAKRGSFRKQLGHSETWFLQNVWGPCMNYNFEGLSAEYPLKDFRGGLRFVDFMFVMGLIRLLIEIDGFTTHARDISKGDFNDHLMRQNDLLLNGWFLLRFSTDMVEREPERCKSQLMQALGYLWSKHRPVTREDGSMLWNQRKHELYRLAKQRGGLLKPADISKEMSIHRYTAVQWMRRFAQEGLFRPIRGNRRIMGYRLVE